jgi:hypothetical protein
MNKSPAALIAVAGLLAAFALGLAARTFVATRDSAAAAPAGGPRVHGPPATAPSRAPRPLPATVPTTLPANEQEWADVAAQLGRGTLSGEVYTITLPRTDLDVGHIDLGPLPVEAGLASQLHFFICPCGKASVVGQLCVADYELNDVIDELRSASIKIAGISPMFIGEKPRVMSLRLQAEGSAYELAAGIKKALSWTGEQRNQVQ